MDSKIRNEISDYLVSKGVDCPSDNDVSRAYDEYMRFKASKMNVQDVAVVEPEVVAKIPVVNDPEPVEMPKSKKKSFR